MPNEKLLEVLFTIFSNALYTIYMALHMDKDVRSHDNISNEAWLKLQDITTMHQEFEA